MNNQKFLHAKPCDIKEIKNVQKHLNILGKSPKRRMKNNWFFG